MLLNYDCLVNLCWYLPIRSILALSRADKTLHIQISAEIGEIPTLNMEFIINNKIVYGIGIVKKIFGIQLFTGSLVNRSIYDNTIIPL